MQDSLVLDPFGTVIELERHHSASLFEVSFGMLNGQPVCIKAPPKLDREHEHERVSRELGRRYDHLVSCTAHFAGCGFRYDQSEGRTPAKIWRALLEAECAGIKQAGKAWNHGVLGVATILERHGVSEFEETPALLMPRYTGHSFDSLEPHRKREPFPKLLPALWSALCACPHGDLDEGSIFMDQDGGFFRLIDPGVMTITNSYTRGEEQLREEHFLTNVVHYPVLMPQFGPRVHRAWRGGLAEQLGTVDRSSESETDGDQRVQQNRPAAPDLLALGIMYLRILTGTEFGRMIDRPAPFWTYAIKDYRPLDRSDYARLQGTLDSGLLDYLTTNQAHTPDASERERVLCRRLLALDFADRGELLKCI